MNDLKFAFRQLLKNPGFTTIVVLTLALGIGANTAIFSVVNAVLLRPLPFKDSDRLVMLWQEYPKRGWSPRINFSFPNYADVKEQNQVFQNVGAIGFGSYTLTDGGDPERLNSFSLSASLLPTLGIEPFIGKNFLEQEDQAGATRVVLLSHHIWQQRFGADPALVGKTIMLNGSSSEVIGILPKNFGVGDNRPDLCVPLRMNAAQAGRGARGLQVVARLKPNVTLEQAQAEMTAMAGRLGEIDRITNGDMGISVIRLREQFGRNDRRALLVLFGAVGFVLLIACANIVNLLLARAAGRQREVAVRAALGASRLRLIRQMLTESLTLSVCGGALGLGVGWWGMKLLVAFAPGNNPRIEEVGLDGPVLGFTFLLALLTGLIFGIVPALHASKPDLNDSLREGTKGACGNLARHRVRGSLVVAEIALALMLLVGAGLMMKSFVRLQAVDPGFDPENLLTMQVSLPQRQYSNQVQRLTFYREAFRRLEALPGTESVTAASAVPFGGGSGNSGVSIEGRTFSPNEYPHAKNRSVHPNYFRVIGIPIVRGRHFEESDNATAPSVVIINQAMARGLWPEGDPIGQRIRPDGFPRDRWIEIVGIARDVKNSSLDSDAGWEIYLPYLQNPGGSACFFLRTTVKPMNLAGSARQQVWSVDKDLAISSIKTMDRLIAESIAGPSFTFLLFGVFAVVALLLAAGGIYGVMAYSVSQRTREIGIRMALGAKIGDVHQLILRQGMTLTLIGIAVGLLGAFALTRLLSTLLFNVSTTDGATFFGVTFLLSGVALAAGFIPARRAAKIDPMEALRHE